MPKIIEGHLQAKGLRFALVVSRFNEFISERLVSGCLDALHRHGSVDGDLQIYKVPGSFELPLVAKKLAESKEFDAVICLGALIRGSTPHFDFLSAEVVKGIANTALQTGVPISFGVLTADTLEQAIERAGSKLGNKGWDAAISAIEMVNLYHNM
ncbi:6,7-dimethyl-8-ribityllumazine synthase [bacterium (candidate division B38) B3_B38]|nr:MAG: 6,7-dimethyl-8-ribityllumazine synthase [bacterium (candidate division B38) B3_B38]